MQVSETHDDIGLKTSGDSFFFGWGAEEVGCHE